MTRPMRAAPAISVIDTLTGARMLGVDLHDKPVDIRTRQPRRAP